MATEQQNAPDGVPSNLKPDPSATIPRMKLGETGFSGLRAVNKYIIEDPQISFRFPQFIKVVDEMRNNPTVGAAINVYRMMINRVKWSVKPPVGASKKAKDRSKVIQSMLDDMDHSWSEFIDSIIPYLEYGFAVNEMVFRRRLKRYGSKFNDGLIGLAKLAPRSQDTIVGWVFDDTGSELLSIEQTLVWLRNAQLFVNRANEDGRIPIPIEKVLLFTCNKTKGNPQGNSIYKNIYLAFKQLTMLQDQQLLGVAKNIQGILKIEVPAFYLNADASPDQQATVAGFQKIIDRYNDGTQRGLLVPRVIDDTGQAMFTYDLMPSAGQSPYDIESIITGLQQDILTALNVDVLKLGANGSGSFSLAEAKTSILALAIDSRLKEIASVLNHKLITTLYQLNGWELEELPEFCYEQPEEIDLDSFSAAVQRIFAVSAVEIDRPVLNRVRKMLGVPERPEDEEVNEEELPAAMTGQTSKSGAGQKVGTSGNGTAKNAVSGGGDSSVANKENAP